jgi:hypothetical protein
MTMGFPFRKFILNYAFYLISIHAMFLNLLTLRCTGRSPQLVPVSARVRLRNAVKRSMRDIEGISSTARGAGSEDILSRNTVMSTSPGGWTDDGGDRVGTAEPVA